jgi:hypothetical protein
MELFDFAWFTDFYERIKDLDTLVMKEDWDYKKKPTGKNPILVNYIKHTFKKLFDEGKVTSQNGYAVFNTGLVTDKQEEVYAFFQQNKFKGTIPWYFTGWRKASDRDLMRFSKLPEIANYFQDPTDLIYDSRLDLRVNLDHIIDDNIARFPASLQSIDRSQLSVMLGGTIEDAKKRVKRNYKTAIPQYYDGKIQLLLPLCLTSKTDADLALVVERGNNVYRASTCLTLDMAINNARLIAKPDDEWLKI